MFKASCTAVFGDNFPSDEMKDVYARFEQSIPSFMRGYPRILDNEGFEARDKVHKMLTEFFKDPSNVVGASQIVMSHMKVWPAWIDLLK